jgi:hypothetical protein
MIGGTHAAKQGDSRSMAGIADTIRRVRAPAQVVSEEKLSDRFLFSLDF